LARLSGAAGTATQERLNMREMPVSPILASLRRHKLVALLLVLQVAATCAVICNVGFMVVGRWQRMHMPSGVDEDVLELIRVQDMRSRDDTQARHREDLALLRAIPGVQSAVAVDSLPFSQDTWQVGGSPAGSPEGAPQTSFVLYSGSQGELATLGVRLIAGDDFAAADYVPMSVQDNYSGFNRMSGLIVSKALAEHLFPGLSAVGRQIRIDKRDLRIVGVVDAVAVPSPGRADAPDYVAFTPMLPDATYVVYAMRCEPSRCDAIGRKASDALLAAASDRLLDPPQRFTELRNKFFRRDRTMISLLVASALGLLFVTALGIAGLASFWVQQRTRSIGIRRAIGATRGDILRYFQTENFLIVSFGVLPGMFLAIGLNLLLMEHYELPRLPLWYLPVGMLALWILGQLAVLSPALRAASVPPVVATRSV
jgi:putative ABC transport system permease protein